MPITIELDAELERKLVGLVQRGFFDSKEEIVNVALAGYLAEFDLEAGTILGWTVAELEALVDEADDGSPPIPAEEVFAELRARIAARRPGQAA